ncbi:MAG: cytochrome P450 [Actinomycetota bacterium]
MTDDLIPLDDENWWQDPYPRLAEVRDRHRTGVTPDGQRVILRWDDAEACKKSPAFENNGLEFIEERGFRPGDPLYEWRRYSIGALNGAEHHRLRSLVSRAMTVRSTDRMRASARDHVERALRGAASAGDVVEVDIREAFRSAPFFVITEFLGIEMASAIEMATTMGQGSADAFGPNVTAEIRDAANHTFAVLMDFVGGLVEERRAEPRDDLLSALIDAEEAGDRLSHDELVVLFTNIFGGAVESTLSAMTSVVYELARHPDQRELLADDTDAHKRGAVEEVLRHRPSFYAVGQRANAAVELAGVSFAPAENVSIVLGGPNRDPSRWDDPERFDITRDPTVWSFTFSMGPHFCLGQALARTELQETAAAVASLCRDLEVVESPRWKPFSTVNQVEQLRVRYVLADG